MGVLPPAADHRNKSQPKSRHPHRPRALAARCAGIRPRDRAAAEYLLVDCVDESGLFSWLDASFIR